jgi:hypothetical protein
MPRTSPETAGPFLVRSVSHESFQWATSGSVTVDFTVSGANADEGSTTVSPGQEWILYAIVGNLRFSESATPSAANNANARGRVTAGSAMKIRIPRGVTGLYWTWDDASGDGFMVRCGG